MDFDEDGKGIAIRQEKRNVSDPFGNRYDLGDGTDHLTDTGSGNTLKFGAGIAAGDLKLGLGSLKIQVGADPNDVIHLDGFNQDAQGNPTMPNPFHFGPGIRAEKQYTAGGSGRQPDAPAAIAVSM